MDMTIKKIKRKIKKRSLLLAGLAILLVALILAFTSIHVVEAKYESQEKMLEGDDAKLLESRYNPLNSTIDMEFNPVNEDFRGDVLVTLNYTDEDQEDIPVRVGSGEKKTVEFDEDPDIIVSHFNSSWGNLTFTHTIFYERQPYSLLSVPAFLLTIIGLVVVYNGKYKMKVERKMEEEHEKKLKQEKDESEGSSSKPRFMGVDWGKKD